MQLQDLSYTLNNEHIKYDLFGHQIDLSIEMFSIENVYTMNRGSLSVNGNNYSSNEIVWGDTEVVPHSMMEFSLNESKDNVSFILKGQLNQPVISMKLRLEDLPLGTLLSLSENDLDITEYGHLFRYPEGWRSLSYPLLTFKLKDGKYLFIKVMHQDVIPVSFYLRKTGEDKMRVDVTIEEKAHQLKNDFTSCPIEVGIVGKIEDVYEDYSEHIKKTFHLVDYKDNKNIPNWMKDVSLVIIMHMEAFTGHIFHTYEQALNDVKELTKYIDGKRILVYIAGWEGRYYYKYGDYTPDERLGGAIGLKKMIDGMHELGAHVLAMVGMNMANIKFFSHEEVKAMEYVTARGGLFRNGSVDWEGSHSYDYSSLRMFNPGAHKWQDHLFNEIKRSSLDFDFDGVFLDIAAAYVNDQRYPVYDGLKELVKRIKTIKPDYLVAGEGYYDAISAVIDLVQGGHTEGYMNYHDRVYAPLFTRYSREFAHLCLGDLSRGSSGVHEQGTNTDMRTPFREGIIPTLTLVEDTLIKAKDKVLEVIEEAKEYAKRYL